MEDKGNTLRTPTVALGYEDDRFIWKTMQRDKIVLHWYGGSETEAQRLLGYASNSLARIQEDMGLAVQEAVQIYSYRNKEDMSSALSSRSDAYDDRILTLGVAADRATLILLGTHADVEHTIAHELSHIVVGLATENAYSPPPRWLDEGLAMYAEGKLGDNNRRALDNAVKGDHLISVRSLSGYAGDPAQVDLFYGEAYSLIDFMLRAYGRGKMGKLLEQVRSGAYQEDALQQVYGFGLDELDLQWRKSLGLDPRGTRMPGPAATPAPATNRGSRPCLNLIYGLFAAVALVWSDRSHARTA